MTNPPLSEPTEITLAADLETVDGIIAAHFLPLLQGSLDDIRSTETHTLIHYVLHSEVGDCGQISLRGYKGKKTILTWYPPEKPRPEELASWGAQVARKIQADEPKTMGILQPEEKLYLRWAQGNIIDDDKPLYAEIHRQVWEARQKFFEETQQKISQKLTSELTLEPSSEIGWHFDNQGQPEWTNLSAEEAVDRIAYYLWAMELRNEAKKNRQTPPTWPMLAEFTGFCKATGRETKSLSGHACELYTKAKESGPAIIRLAEKRKEELKKAKLNQ